MTGKLEILCVTMHQKDFSKIKSMNIRCDVVFANQADENSFKSIEFDGKTAKMITTTTRGVGLNRNIALAAATGDYLLFADEDMTYNDDLPEKVISAFEELPKADVICFGTHFSKNGKIYLTQFVQTKKLHFFKSLKFGTYAIAIRRKSLLKANLSFTEIFGGGCMYLHGEDSDFIINCYKKGLSIYTYNYILGTSAKDTSTCFWGYNERFFYDTGAFANFALGILSMPYIVYMALRIRNDCTLSFLRKLKLMYEGYKGFETLQTYDQYKSL